MRAVKSGSANLSGRSNGGAYGGAYGGANGGAGWEPLTQLAHSTIDVSLVPFFSKCGMISI